MTPVPPVPPVPPERGPPVVQQLINAAADKRPICPRWNTRKGCKKGNAGIQMDCKGFKGFARTSKWLLGIQGFARLLKGVAKGLNGVARGLKGAAMGLNGVAMGLNGFERRCKGFEGSGRKGEEEGKGVV